MLTISSDGYIRLFPAQLDSLQLEHLVSGLDEDAPKCGSGAAMPTSITGYTEWVTSGVPAVTIGWDWKMATSSASMGLSMLWEPRSNVMLLDNLRLDIGPEMTAAVLADWLNNRDWQSTVAQYIQQRYNC